MKPTGKRFWIAWVVLLTVICVSCNDEIHIAGSYYCYQNNTLICAIHNTHSDMDVPPTVLEYKTDGTYITVKQKPRLPQDAIYKTIAYPDYNPKSPYYWIIEVHSDSIIGPLTYSSFLIECENRNIGYKMQFQ